MKSKGTMLAAATALLTAASITAASAQTPERNSTRMNAGQNPGVSSQMNSPGLNTGQNFQQGGNVSQNANTRVRGNGPNYSTTRSSRRDLDQDRRLGRNFDQRRDFDQNRRLGRNFDQSRRLGRDFDRDRRLGRDFDRRNVAVSGTSRADFDRGFRDRRFVSGGWGPGWNTGWNGGWGGWNTAWNGGGWGWGSPGFGVSVGTGGWGPGLYSYAPGYVGVGFGSTGCTCGGGGPGWWW